MKSLLFVLKENKKNMYKIFRLALYDFVTPLRDTYLGIIWIVLGPLLQIGVYWFVFGVGIREGRDVNGHPYLLWMLAGLVPWFYMSSGISSGALCIYGKASVLTKMKFPTSIIPTYNTITQLIKNLPVMLITFIVYAVYGYKGTGYYLQLIYYIFAGTFFLIGISLLNSALVMAIRDINRVIGTVMRFLFYLTPILWVPSKSKLPKVLLEIMEMNPIYYIVE
ncbi:MAG: ABC transporter permease, partial [Clostridium sp.]